MPTGGPGTEEMQDNHNVEINIEIILKNIFKVSHVISMRPEKLYVLPSGHPGCVSCFMLVGRDSSVGIATRYGLDGLGIESADSCGRAV